MEASFWHERWQQGQIGFHQPDFHPSLPRHWPGLGITPGSRVFVPLCGRSLDMVWLARHGYPVLGVELSQIAAEGFFDHERIVPQVTRQGQFTHYVAPGYEILQGDFFDIAPGIPGPINAWYDRAALIALPPPMRRRYAGHLATLLEPDARGLLMTLEYPQEKMAGPPFSVAVAEVGQLLSVGFSIELLERRDVLSENPRFRDRGLDCLWESCFRIQRR